MRYIPRAYNFLEKKSNYGCRKLAFFQCLHVHKSLFNFQIEQFDSWIETITIQIFEFPMGLMIDVYAQNVIFQFNCEEDVELLPSLM
jgi:hypothetical protein